MQGNLLFDGGLDISPVETLGIVADNDFMFGGKGFDGNNTGDGAHHFSKEIGCPFALDAVHDADDFRFRFAVDEIHGSGGLSEGSTKEIAAKQGCNYEEGNYVFGNFHGLSSIYGECIPRADIFILGCGWFAKETIHDGLYRKFKFQGILFRAGFQAFEAVGAVAVSDQ